eukprot:GHVR01163436.1.p1 GENE.GHVR01163436.1~~GHVR01163436.1.p1  ORF type:complete len:153 (+),score=2.49 GHVR01163436.1:81-539(+)
MPHHHHHHQHQHQHAVVHGAPVQREYRPGPSHSSGQHKSYTAYVEPHTPFVPEEVTRRQRRRRSPSKRTYCLAGVAVIIVGLIMYFAGGYLYVAFYKGTFDFLNKPVDPNWRIVFKYLGPTLFFVGFFVFIFGFATVCKVVRNPCQSQIDYV